MIDYFSRKRFQARARANLDIPLVARDLEFHVARARTGVEVLASVGLSLDETVQEPIRLLDSDAYRRRTILIDPFHPAARALMSLKLSVGTMREQSLAAAVAIAAEVIEDYGVPDEIVDVHAVGQRANDFSAAEVIASCPRFNLSARSEDEDTLLAKIWRKLRGLRNPTLTPAEWVERTDAAYTLVGARAGMPAHHPMRDEVSHFVEMALDPQIENEIVELRGEHLRVILSDWVAVTPKNIGGLLQ